MAILLRRDKDTDTLQRLARATPRGSVMKPAIRGILVAITAMAVGAGSHSALAAVVLRNSYPIDVDRLLPADAALIDDNVSVALLYDVLSNQPPDYIGLARYVPSFRAARITNEFERKRAMDATIPLLDERYRSIQRAKRFVFLSRAVLGSYDFKSRSFPVQILPPERIGPLPGSRIALVRFAGRDQITERLLMDEQHAEQLIRSTRFADVWMVTPAPHAAQRDDQNIEIRIQPVELRLFRPDTSGGIDRFALSLRLSDMMRRGRVVFEDTFAENKNGWALGGGTFGPEGLTLAEAQVVSLPTGFKAIGPRFGIEVSVRFLSADTASTFGLQFGARGAGASPEAYTEFGVSNDGGVSGRIVPTRYPDEQVLPAYTPGAVSLSGWNTIRVLHQGQGAAVLLVNGKLVGALPGSVLLEGGPELVRMRTAGKIGINRFRMVQLPEPFD